MPTKKAEAISVAELAAVKATPTKNKRLLKLIAELTAYNELLKQKVRPLSKLVGHLDAAMEAAAWWLTEKPKKGNEDGNRAKRREALFKIARAISGALADSFGIRPLVGDFSKPNANENYWLERIDKKHRPGFALATHYNVWVEKKPAANEVAEDFWTYMESVPVSQENKAWKLAQDLQLDPSVYGDEKNKKAAEDELKKVRANLADLKLDVKQLEVEARAPYVVKPDGGKLVGPDGEAFCTQSHKTHFSGAGWAIFVFAAQDVEGDGKMKDTLYARSHTRGEFHHSTFLAGAPVKAAGELVVAESGKVAVVTNKSGHYQPTPAELLTFVKHLQSNQVLSGDAVVISHFELFKGVKGSPMVMTCQRLAEFLKGAPGRFLTPKEAWALLPKWSQSPEAKKHFDGIQTVDLYPDGANEQAKVNGDPSWGFTAERDGPYIRVKAVTKTRFGVLVGDLVMASKLAKKEMAGKPPGERSYDVVVRHPDDKVAVISLKPTAS